MAVPRYEIKTLSHLDKQLSDLRIVSMCGPDPGQAVSFPTGPIEATQQFIAECISLGWHVRVCGAVLLVDFRHDEANNRMRLREAFTATDY